jgi:hypothetical protein
MDVSPRGGAARGTVTALAAAGASVLAVRLWMPPSLLHALGPPPVPRIFAVAALIAAAVVGAVVGTRAARTLGTPRRRRARLAGWTGLGYLATVVPVAAAARVASLGVEMLVVPLQLLVGGVMASVLFLPWAAVPALAAAITLEAWTRPRHSVARLV